MEIYQEHSPVHKGVVSFACDLPNSTPVSTRPGRKPLSAYNSNSGRKGTPHAKMKSRSDMRKERTVLKTPLSVTINTEKENQPSSSTVFDAMSSPPNSAQSFRRALRGTPPKQGAIPIGQTIFALPEENAMDEVEQKTISFATKRGGGLLSKRSQLVVRPLVGGALGPPQRVAPKTPNFLLRTEFDDDSMNEMEESLLVSPPGALWSVLGAAHDPSSASSTGIVIVPPHTAATIHEITTSQKKRQEQRSWTSPPLQPRSLLRTTPEGEQEADDESEQQNDRALNIITESPEIILPTTRKSVAMDLSTMFSDERKQKPTKPTNQPNPPQHLLRRLQKPTVSSNAAIEPKQALLLASKEQKIVDSTLLNTKKEGLDVVVAPVCGENREAINLPNLASSKASTILLGTPPQHFSKCRSKPDVSSCKELPRDEAVDHEGLSFEPRSVRVAQKAPLNARKTEILHVSSGKGISMDMSNLLSDVTTTTLQHAIPPPHLLKRLEQRTFKKTHSNKRVGKENEAPEASKIPANTNPPIRNVLAIRSSATSSLKTGPGRALRVPTSKAEAKERPSLQKNDKFFPGPTAISPSKGEIESKGIRIGVKFEISPPVPKEDKVVKKTRPPPGSPKARSPIKITRGPDDWAAKQCDTFVSWLNYTFHPDDDEEDDSTLNRSGLRALVIHRRLAQVRYRAAELFQSDEMRRVRTIVQSEISRGRLTIRSDRDLYADLSLRKQAINLLLSYTTPWLRLGLEVMFGECIMPDNLHVYGTSQMAPVGRMRMTLRTFVVDRVLSDSNVLMKYTKGKTKVPSGNFERLYREEMRILVLYRLMVLILFLDHAKMENVLDNVPRLFTKSSEVKSSKAVLLAFCRDFLSAEGDFIKHLSRIGLHVSYIQDPIDELEFHVTNLATDLRDGCCLTRMTEIITNARFKCIMQRLRLPAVSRLQKMHNVNVALSELSNFGIVIPNDLHAHHVVDAHREMVLKLMWSVVAHNCMTKLLVEGQVEHEIENVLRSLHARRRVQGLRLRSPQRLSPTRKTDTKETPEEALKCILFRWCKAVCSNFDYQLDNLTTSFADGKAFCYLLHYYHPSLLRLDEILPTSMDEYDNLAEEQALTNERANSAMVAKRVAELGGIPKMLPVTDSKNPPDEKSMILCLVYLCSRLMESSEEIFATILIQACYRRYCKRKIKAKKEAAAQVIFQLWCEYKHRYFAAQQRRYTAAVAVLENFVCSHKHALLRMKCKRLALERRIFAATEIQRCFRGLLGRAHFHSLREKELAAIVVQKYFRRFAAQVDTLEAMLNRDAATLIQRSWRSWRVQRRFDQTIACFVRIQCAWRGFLVRKSIKHQHFAAMTIQQAWWSWVDYADSQVAAIQIQRRIRGILARRYCQKIISLFEAVTKIQKIWRGYCQSIVFEITREFAISIQKLVRGFLVRKSFSMEKMSAAAVVVQKTWRCFFAQLQYNLDVLDVVCIQCLVRTKAARKVASRRFIAIACLQRAVRCALARRKLQKVQLQREYQLKQNNATIVCQCALRVWRARSELFSRYTVNRSAKAIQSSWRRFVCRKMFLQYLSAITLVQSTFRAMIARQRWHTITCCTRKIQRNWRLCTFRKLQNESATMIQANWRCKASHSSFRLTLSSTIIIQTRWRSSREYKKYSALRFSAVSVQACWRRYSARLNYELDILEIVIAQSVVRRMLAQIAAKKRQQSLKILQNFLRRLLALTTMRHLRYQHDEFVRRCRAAIIIQCLSRRLLAKRFRFRSVQAATILNASVRMAIHRKRFVSIKLVVVRTQALYRGHVQRTNQRLVHYQAVIIQRNWRCFFQFTKYMIAYGDIVIAQCAVRRYLCIMRAMRLRAANIVLQCAARQKLACRRVREIRSMTRAAQQIQAAYRGSLTRQEFWWKHSQATLIQAQYRGHISRVLFALERYDVAVVQSLVRRWLARRFVLRTRDGIVALQAAARALIARRTMHQLWLQKRTNEARVAAGVTVQNAYRGYLVRRNMAVLHEMATCIQATFRRHYQHLWYCMYLIDVTIVQSQVRRWIVKHRLKQAHSSAIVLQSCARKMQANREVANMRSKKLLRENQNLACIALQKDWRGHKSRKLSEMHASARKIQKTWRCFVAHVEYLVQQISVIRLQAHIRRFQVQRIFEKTKIGFVRLQAATRGFLKREHVRFISMSAIIVQSCFRGHLQRRAFLYARRSATLIQGVARGYFVRDELLLSHFAATEIQRVWRGFIQFCDFFVHLEATVKLQSFFRKIRAIMQLAKLKLTAHVDRCFYNNKARTIQCKCRAYLHRMRITRATKMIQRLAKSYIRDRQASVVDRGVKRLQAVVRAKEIRRRRTKEVAAVVVRLHMAHKKARRDPKLQIGYKTRHALEVLQTSRSLAEIMDAVKSLETSTRLSPLCCVLFTEANAARILLDLIRSCNRSVPHVELVQCILLTLDNVSQYRKLVPSFADYNSAEIFLDKMQMFRDKDGIFCLSTSLLKCIAKCNPIVEEFCAMHEHLKRLKALHQLSLRRSKSSVSGMKRDVSKKLNRMKRREHFDRNVAIKSLGEMVEKFESHEFVSSTMETGRQHHFTF